MKILHIINSLKKGGAEGNLYRLCNSHKEKYKNKIGITIITLLSNGYYEKQLKKKGIKIFSLNINKKNKIIDFIKTIKILREFIKKKNPDIIQSWMYHADLVSTLALLLSGRIRKTRLYWGVRCSDMDTSKYRVTLRIAIWACSWLSWVPHGIIANSFAGMQVHKDLGYASEQFFVIPN